MTRGEFFSGPVKNQKCEKMQAERGVVFGVWGREIMRCAGRFVAFGPEISGSSGLVKRVWVGCDLRLRIPRERTRPQNVMDLLGLILLRRLGSQSRAICLVPCPRPERP
jgi:hypothetical protein